MQKIVQQSICKIDIYQFDEYYEELLAKYDNDFIEDNEDLLELFNFEFETNLTLSELLNFLSYRQERIEAKITYNIQNGKLY